MSAAAPSSFPRREWKNSTSWRILFVRHCGMVSWVMLMLLIFPRGWLFWGGGGGGEED